MYALHSQTDPPTSVNCAAYGRIFNLQTHHLVTAASNTLRVYKINKGVHTIRSDGSIGTDTKFECVLQLSLFATIESMTIALVPGQPRECIFLALKDAKLSVLQYDSETHGFRTVSLHSFEDKILMGGITRNVCSAVIRRDPDNRCVCMLVYGRYLAVVPFIQKISFPDNDARHGPLSAKLNGPQNLGLRSYAVALSSIEEKLYNITDIGFLHGYYEPTLLVLYEPIPTTTSRLALRSDTFCIIAVSLNIKDRAEAVIWTLRNLPYDCFKVMPVPKPIGGTIVFGANEIIYLSQSVPPLGIAVNSNLKSHTRFPLKDQEYRKMMLDRSNADFINPNTLVLCLRSGDLYVVTLLADKLNTVKSIHVDRAASSVITSVVCTCDSSLMFLGSRLGNSLLLRYWERGQFAIRVETSGEQMTQGQSHEDSFPLAAFEKRPKTAEHSHEDMDIYGEVVAVHHEEMMRIEQYGFEVCDSMLNVGPCKHFTIGDPPASAAIYEEEYLAKNGSDPIVDLVCASGHGKNGAISVFHRTIRPHIVTSSTIPNARKLWTGGQVSQATVENSQSLTHVSGEPNEPPELIAGAQQYLLIGKEMDTMVLEMKAEITELEETGFEMNQHTIAIGNLGNGEYLVQTTPMSLILLHNASRVQYIPLDIAFPVAQASIADPYVILLTDNGELLLAIFEPNQEGFGFHLKISEPQIQQPVPATAISTYKDVSGIFTTVRDSESFFLPTKSSIRAASAATDSGSQENRFAEEEDPYASQTKPSFVKKPPILSGIVFNKPVNQNLSAQEEEDLLYGTSSTLMNGQASSQVKGEITSQSTFLDGVEAETDREELPFKQDTSVSIVSETTPITFWAFVCRENGLLEIFTLPDFKLVYMVKRFPLNNPVLADTDPVRVALEAERSNEEKFPVVREILVCGLGPNKSRPHVFAIAEQELVVYEAFQYSGSEIVPDHLAIRFKKLQHRVFLRNHRSVIRSGRAAKAFEAELANQGKQMYEFDNVSGYAGIFICGAYPYFVIMTAHGILRCHPMTVDGHITSFAPFHNVNCYNGFIYLNVKHEMKICQLSSSVLYDSSHPVQKIALKSTVHFIEYLLDSKTYAVTLSTPKETKTVVTILGDEKIFETVEREEPHFIYPKVEQFTIQLYSPENWESIPGCKLDLDEFEHATVVKEVQLKSEGHVSGYANYLAVGTMYNYGEDVMVRGRVVLCEVVEVVPEPGQPLTRFKMKSFYAKEQKGPVTSLCSVLGYLLTGMGQKVYIWQLRDNDLVGISFLDLQFYTHRMVSLRGLVLCGDVFKSVSLLRYQEGCKALSLASRDVRNIQVAACEFFVDGRLLSFLVSDTSGRLYLYAYQPEVQESQGGTKLLRRGEFNFGSPIQALYRIRCHIGDPIVEHKIGAGNRHLLLYGSMDGALGFIIPLPEKTYRRLFMLQNLLTNYLPHCAGANPKAHRSVKNAMPAMLMNPQKNFIDGDLLYQYIHLNLTQRFEVAKRIGTNREQIMDDLLEIQRMATHI